MSHDDWEPIIKRYMDSGLTQKDFCKKEGLVFLKFKYHWDNYRKRQSIKTTPHRQQRFEPIAFEQVSSPRPIENAPQTTCKVSLKLPNAFECQLDFSGSMMDVAVFLKEVAK